MSDRPKFTLLAVPFTVESLAAMFKVIADREPTPEEMQEVGALSASYQTGEADSKGDRPPPLAPEG